MIVPRIPAAMAVAAVLAIPTTARADLGFPEYAKFPPQLQTATDYKLTREDLGEAEFAVDKSGSNKATKRGVHWFRWFTWKPAAGEPAPGYYNGTEERIWKAMTAALAKEGWQPVYTDDNKAGFTLKLEKNGKESWLAVKMDAPQAQVNVEMIEIGTAANKLVLTPPDAKPETFGDAQDIPYLPPWPGSTRNGGGRGDGPMSISIPGKSDSEPMLVGTGVVTRNYQGPSSLSKLQFVRDYREALVKAGWTIVYPDEKSIGDHSGIVAHYTQRGRDVWARLVYEFGASLSNTVVDVGSEDWAAKLDRNCRLPLYGVFFDFNKSTLKPESDPVLAKAAALMKARPAISAEVQGHTDNVGGDDYNQKLSAARAASVQQWLSQHGVEAKRLASKGYGKTQPVADNSTDEGRARNRRVELVKMGCQGK